VRPKPSAAITFPDGSKTNNLPVVRGAKSIWQGAGRIGAIARWRLFQLANNVSAIGSRARSTASVASFPPGVISASRTRLSPAQRTQRVRLAFPLVPVALWPQREAAGSGLHIVHCPVLDWAVIYRSELVRWRAGERFVFEFWRRAVFFSRPLRVEGKRGGFS